MKGQSNTSTAATGARTSRLPTVSMFLGVLQAAAILGFGLIGTPGHSPTLGWLFIYAPLFAMTMVNASVPQAKRPRTAWFHALLPLAVALAVVTHLIGMVALPDSTAWWTVGAIVSGLPYFALARLWSIQSRHP